VPAGIGCYSLKPDYDVIEILHKPDAKDPAARSVQAGEATSNQPLYL